MSIGKKAGKGFIRLFQRNMLEKLMGLTTIIILARKLTPYDFGLVSITEVLLYTISVFGTTGLSEFLLAYKKDDVDEIFKAAFWFNLVLSVIILALFLGAAPFWANYQNDPRILNISLIAGGIFLFSQIGIIPRVRLNKDLRFDKQVQIQTPFTILIPLAKVAAVFAGWGVYSLILPTLILTPIQSFFFYYVTKLRPGWNMYTNRWKEIYSFTKHLIGSGLLRRLADNGDKFIISKLLGLEMLGLYNIAMRMAELFTTQLTMMSNNVLAAVLPKYTDDKKMFYKYYMNSLKAFAFVMLPFLAVMMVAAKPIILLFYGAQWVDAVLPMQILIVYTALRSVTSSFSVVMNSFHLNKLSFKVNMFFTPTHLVASAIGGYLWGIPGVALALVLVRAGFYNWRINLMMKAVEEPVIRWYKDLMPYFLITVIVIGVSWLGSYYMFSSFPDLIPVLSIAIISTAIVVIYNLLVKIFYPQELKTISGFLGGAFPKVQPHFNRLYGL